MAGLEWDLTRILAGLLMLTVAMWVVALEPRSRLMQLFAVFMVFRGLVNIMLPFADERFVGGGVDALTTTLTYYQIAVPFAAMAFALYLLLEAPWRRRALWGLALVGLLFETLYFFDKSVFYGPEGRGWMYHIIGLQGLAYVVVGHALLRGKDVPAARFVAGVAYMLFPVYAATLGVAEFADAAINNRIFAPGVNRWSDFSIRAAALLYAIVATVLLSVEARGSRRIWSLVALGTAVVTGIVPVVLARLYGLNEFVLSLPMNGVFTAAMPVAVTWALTHDAFYTEYRTIRMGVWVVTSLFAAIWLLIVGALYAAVEGATAAAAITGALALAVLLFLLLQSGGIEEPSRGQADNDEVP